jgi:Toprim domain
VLGEGVETTLAAATRITHRGTYLRPAWAAGSSGNMATLPPLTGIESLTLLVDHDGNGAGERAAEQCARHWSDAGKEVIRLMPGELGDDFNDLVVKSP